MKLMHAMLAAAWLYAALGANAVSGGEPPTMTKEAEAQGKAIEVEPDMEKLPPGWLSLDSSVGVVDYQVQKTKKQIERALFGGQMQLSGFLQTTYTVATSHPKDPSDISIRSFILDNNKITFNAFNLTLERPLPDGDWGFGLKLSMLAGRTAELLREATLWGQSLTSEPSVELYESYFSTRIPIGTGLEFQGGLWVTTLGTEIIDAPGDYNYNITRSFLFGYSIPFRHLGGMFSYAFTDWMSANFAVVTGWDNPRDNNQAPSVISGISFESRGGTFGSNHQFIWGPYQDDETGPKRWAFANTGTYTGFEDTTLAGEITIGQDRDYFSNGASALWYGMAGYVSYDWTPRFNTAFRGEWFRDKNGARTGGGASGIEKDVWLGEMTLTLGYRFTSQLLGRWEVRQDFADRDVYQKGRSGSTDQQTQFSLQAVYTF